MVSCQKATTSGVLLVIDTTTAIEIIAAVWDLGPSGHQGEDRFMAMFGLHDDEEEEEGSMFGAMFGPKMGTWWVHSKKDPRWNKEGRAKGLVCMGGPAEMEAWIEKCTKKYGKPPKDCTHGFMKD